MDWGHVPELFTHFVVAAQYFPLAEFSRDSVEIGRNIWTALSHINEMPPETKNLHVFKLASTTGILIASAATLNGLGVAGTMASFVEEGFSLNSIGRHLRGNYPSI